jgi:hypothetical protein
MEFIIMDAALFDLLLEKLNRLVEKAHSRQVKVIRGS